jgi:hypothetical protein
MAPMTAVSLEDLRVRADRIVRRLTDGDCGCYSDQAAQRMNVGCLSFLACATCGGRVTHDRRRLIPSSALV